MRISAAVLAAAVLGAACGGARSGSVPLGTVPTTSPPPSAPGTTAPPAATTTTLGSSPRTTISGEELSGFQTEPFRREHRLVAPPLPTLTAIRSATHPGFDRVVLDLEGPLPGAVSVRYVDQVIADGSGTPVPVAGRAFLQVRLEEAGAHTGAGAPTVPRRSRPDLPVLTEVVLAGDFEGYVTIALGLAARTPFRVLELSNPTRVVVDVAR